MSHCSKTKVFERKNGRVLHEFNCSNCGGYITVKLDEDLNGAHCVVCPSCNHEHYRIIKDGCITEDRAPDRVKKYAIRICPTKSAFSTTSWESKLINRKTKVAEEGKHFLGDLWKGVVNKQKQTPPECHPVDKIKGKYKNVGQFPKCIACGCDLSDAPGIGLFCANKKCLQVDNQRTIVTKEEVKQEEVSAEEVGKKFMEALHKPKDGPRCPTHGLINCITCKIPSPIPGVDESDPLNQIIYFCKSNKEACISIENFEWAIKWRDFEKEFIARKGK